MPSYKAPIRDLQFVYHELLNADAVFAEVPEFKEASDDLVDAILEEGAKICEEVLQPINQNGDQEGCQFNNGTVTTPKGFKEAYDTFIEGGWPALALSPDIGGQGLPETISFMLEEMICSANVSFSLYPGLTRGAISAISAHAVEALKEQYLPKMAEGIWAGTMCLTEPHCGTDLGLVRTKAEPDNQGGYDITGTKIFISGGEQDLTENIVHLTLARLPGAPEGVRGISLFLVPKLMPDADNNPGEANGVTCGSIEHKMGIKGSATCVINFDNAKGYLIGTEGKGLACMFTMMNAERLAIGMQGLGLGEVAYQNAVEYARDRLQSRSATGVKAPEKAADPLLVHPDIRRMLLTTRAYNEGARALAVWTAMNIDIAHKHPNAEKRQASDDLVALITPIIKAFFSDYGYETTTMCQQVFGGHGYIQEWGMEQFVRDARIAQIYEGANGIQALDLVRRKLFINEGRLPKRMFSILDNFIAETSKEAALTEYLQPLQEANQLLQSLTQWLVENSSENADELGAAATDYLRIFALTVFAWFWVQMAQQAQQNIEGDDAEFYQTKLKTARFYLLRILPQIHGLDKAVRSGSDLMMDFDESVF